MSYTSSLEAKELVRQAIDIVELVGRSVSLRRQGRIYVGLCPWHEDTRPSLQVNPERQSFKCWVCDIGGDVFSFVMKRDGVSFPEALAMLADQAGIPLRRPGESPRDAAGTAADKRHLYQAMAWAETQYHQCLLSDPEAEPARKYLQERGVEAASISRFHLGFAPNRWDWLQRRAAGAGFSTKALEAVGLVVPSPEGGSPYDRFRGRVLFSIRDVQGRPIALGGRVLPESGSTSPAKYINSPETPLFTKSNQFYGLDVARDAIRKSRTALVMEGYTDCIMAHQHGFPSAVAVLGTALGSQHVRILKRFSADRIVLMLDGDEAGRRRANEVLQLFVAEEVDLRVVTLAEGLDPCEFLQKRGGDAFREILAAKMVDALEHKFRVSTEGLDFERDVEGVHRALEEMLALVANAPRLSGATEAQQRNREWKMLNTLALKFRLPEETIRARLRELRSAQRRAGRAQAQGVSPPADVRSTAAGKLDVCEREMLEVLVQDPACVATARREIDPAELTSDAARRIYAACLKLSEGGTELTFERLMLEFDDPAIKALLVDLDENGRQRRVTDPDAVLTAALATFRQRRLEREFPKYQALMREPRVQGDEADALEKLRNELMRQPRHGIPAPTDG